MTELPTTLGAGALGWRFDLGVDVLDHLTLPDGSRLDYFAAGDGDALLIYHHGTPAAGPLSPAMVEEAAHHGFVVAELVRPGYGQSTRQPGRTVADIVPLASALADHLGFERFATMGWSGGGPHAIATAALLPDRCAAAMCLAAVAPYGMDDLDFLDGMGEDNIAEFGAALDGSESLEAFLTVAAEALREVTADQVIDALITLLPAADQAYLTGDQAEEMAAEIRWSLHRGIWGWFDDDIAFTLPWGFDLTEVSAPVEIWQGSEDLMVPFAHGQWLAARVAGARAQLVEGHGHLSLADVCFAPGFAALRAAL